ncbi:hypothetical protein TRFO_35068 [Tritrichomonas foetus]|uniref:Myb-like DNA-binding domain containing protein n=1 Tax=Tritrichomonas foetus TaxID=1144522 RepID=A0A1J4JH77_9EUKA|nr:hypothetical protein TRFO_35068 [Tritrichomonas foetus]|eukprot:OHS98498.1 hypothetical protein TRFO_35068 [Tritrichomonas foetus]
MRTFSNKKLQLPKKYHRSQFTKEEDCELTQLVEQFGTNSWEMISSKMMNRTIRQCKERWQYYLSPDVSNEPWTEEEETLLIQKYKEMGPKWKQIAECFHNRTSTMIKNKWLCYRRKKFNTEFYCGQSRKKGHKKDKKIQKCHESKIEKKNETEKIPKRSKKSIGEKYNSTMLQNDVRIRMPNMQTGKSHFNGFTNSLSNGKGVEIFVRNCMNRFFVNNGNTGTKVDYCGNTHNIVYNTNARSNNSSDKENEGPKIEIGFDDDFEDEPFDLPNNSPETSPNLNNISNLNDFDHSYITTSFPMGEHFNDGKTESFTIFDSLQDEINSFDQISLI